MVIARVFLALAAGFASTALLVIVVTVGLRRIAPEWVIQQTRPRPSYVAVNLMISFLAAAAGGYVTAWASAGPGTLNAVLGLAVVVLVLGAISALQARGRQALWYQIALIVIAPLGVIAGGLLRLRVLGVL